MTMAKKISRMLRGNALIITTLLAIVLGFCLGAGIREADPSPHTLMWLGLPGDVFLNCLKATIVPVIVCMMITVTALLDPKSNGKIALVATAAFFLTGVAAVLMGLIMFFIFRPEAGSLSGSSVKEVSGELDTQDVFADLIRNVFPDNIVSATFLQTTTQYKKEIKLVRNVTDNSIMEVVVNVRSSTTTDGVNILGLITICTAIGIAANKSLPQNSVFLTFFKNGQKVVFVIIGWLFWITPIGVASLIAKSVASVDDIGAIFYSLGMLVAATIIGLLLHLLVTLPIAIFVFTRKNPYIFLARCLRPFFIAFAASATSVALPEMLTSCERNNLDHSVSSFVIPMSVTLHADGSGLFMMLASLFIAQSSGMGIPISKYFSMGLLASVFSLAIPPLPSASIVNIIIILSSGNYPLEDVAVLFAVEWFLDRCRSAVIAASHVVCAGITDAICKPEGGQGQGQEPNPPFDSLTIGASEENGREKETLPLALVSRAKLKVAPYENQREIDPVECKGTHL